MRIMYFRGSNKGLVSKSLFENRIQHKTPEEECSVQQSNHNQRNNEGEDTRPTGFSTRHLKKSIVYNSRNVERATMKTKRSERLI